MRTPESTALSAEGRRSNLAGTQRVVRLSAVYLIVLAALYTAFSLYSRSSPAGSTAGAQAALLEFGLVALALAVAGTLLTLTPAPRAIEAIPEGFVVVGRWGQRTEWSPLDQVIVRLVRRYPPGLLSEEAVDSVEVSGGRVRRRSYLVQEGLLPETPLGRTTW